MRLSITYKKLTCILNVFLYMTASLQPVLADDTEVYVGQKLVAGSVIRPNVLFIIDTSGSMKNPVDMVTIAHKKMIYEFNRNAARCRNRKMSVGG